MTALSCNPIPLGFSSRPFTQHDPGMYGNCLVVRRFILCIILPLGCSQDRVQSEGRYWPRRGTQEPGRGGKTPLYQKRGFALKRWKPGVWLSGGNAPPLGQPTLRQMCSCDEGFCRARHFQATFKMSISCVWNHSGCHSWVTLGLSWGVFRESGCSWHQKVLVCETQSITNNIFFKDSYLLSYVLKHLFSMFIWCAQKDKRKASGLEPHYWL